jgi:hypothetical protein
MLTKELALVLADENIRVNTINPGTPYTSMLDQFSEGDIEQFESPIPLDSLIEPSLDAVCGRGWSDRIVDVELCLILGEVEVSLTHLPDVHEDTRLVRVGLLVVFFIPPNVEHYEESNSDESAVPSTTKTTCSQGWEWGRVSIRGSIRTQLIVRFKPRNIRWWTPSLTSRSGMSLKMLYTAGISSGS